MSLITIVEGVEFNTIAREWRMKWSIDDDKKSLVEIQKVVDQYLPAIKSIDGVKDVQRIVCGGCLDYKLIISLPVDKYTAWGEQGHSPEAEFLSAVSAIPGVNTVETQTFTIMPM